MKIGVVGAGVNGLCCALNLASKGHAVHVFEKGNIMQETSKASSKLLHGGIRYLENFEFRLVQEALGERDAWLKRVPQLTAPIRLIVPIYRKSNRPRWKIKLGLWVYDFLSRKSPLPGSAWVSREDILGRTPGLSRDGLVGGFEYSDAQMDDYKLGLWVADQAKKQGVVINENCPVSKLDDKGGIFTIDGARLLFDRVINVAGPWAADLLTKSGIGIPYRLDLIRGSHLVIDRVCSQGFLLEVPNERRVVFVLPWKGETLLGTTEVRQTIAEKIVCSEAEKAYLLGVYRHYFPLENVKVLQQFSGVRPLVYSSEDPGKATREYIIHRDDRLITVFGGKWTTAMSLSEKVSSVV